MKNTFLNTIIFLLFITGFSQKTDSSLTQLNSKIQKPKLVVGVVVDQMRYDYLTRFYDQYGENGFKKLMNEGFNCENTHLNYIPTHTAVGHTSIYTGTTPNIHGIIGNNWYDKLEKKNIYCVDDKNYTTVGAKKGGKKSPYRLKVSTISDQLNLAQQKKGKVIGISLKDRAAILPVGHSANAAYWLRGKKDGKFITSSYYMDKLPKWVNKFNNKKLINKYLSKPWNTLYNIKTYTNSINDNNSFEKPLKGEKKVTFPHNLPKIFKDKGNYSLIKSTPFGNTLLLDFAKATILGENLGKNNATDFLSISFSSTDYIGHTFGVDSKEIEDTYLRMDNEIANLINFLDTQVGENNYTLFLTADHGALSSYKYLESLKIPSLFFEGDLFKKHVKDLTIKHFNSSNLVEKISNFQLFFNKDELNKLQLSKDKVSEILIDELINFEGIARCISAKTLQTSNFTDGILHYAQNGYNQKLSGDLILIPQPNTVTYHKKGSEHSTGYSYDTHVPLLFYGFGIKQGNSKKYIPIVDIAPTISSILKIENANGNNGKIIEEALK